MNTINPIENGHFTGTPRNPEVDYLSRSPLPTLKTQYRQFKQELVRVEANERHLRRQHALDQDPYCPDLGPERTFQPLKDKVLFLRQAIELRLEQTKNGQYFWTPKEYVLRFESGDMNYAHLADPIARYRLQRAFAEVHRDRIPPSQEMIEEVARQINNASLNFPMTYRPYTQARESAGRTIYSQNAF
ncbi:uncharacterized protein LY89DRAFT_663764 [Mollisia scopiformis]|uniref:Uncharacterized protein n=1 Tax=Mollisia scopiformis TaxID=149040 RepID=A0A194XUC8_MOLSC|nr:uncharacterized protein LY89DRAFT_663764 [Mollisia scopiformis]KUJ23312.1 hypothetical protein LY89DRAFT_663764 [Mollisia scopiformis]